jgi:DNA-binding CsgD family transcriptional regulator
MTAVDPGLLRHARAARGYLVVTVALGLVVTGLIVTQAALLAHALSAAALGAGARVLAGTLALLLGVVVARAAASYGGEAAALRAAACVKSQLRRKLTEHCLRLGPTWLGGQQPGRIAAELRLLPLLSTHLSFAEIAAELFVSPNTAKTHAVSIYRKLDAGNRGQAVARPGNWACWKADEASLFVDKATTVGSSRGHSRGNASRSADTHIGAMPRSPSAPHDRRRWNLPPAMSNRGPRRRGVLYGPDSQIPGDLTQAGDHRRRLRRRPGRARARSARLPAAGP